MAGISFPVGVELGALIPQGSRFTRDVFPNLAAAVEMMGKQAHEDWVAFAMGRPLPGGLIIQNRTGEYARSILVRSTGDFAAEVYSELPYARAVEEGMPERDMKRMLQTSMKVRRTKDGRKYLIIPFRANSPGSVQGNAVPQQVMDFFRQANSPSSISGSFRRTSGQVASDVSTRKQVTVPGWNYNWGARLGKRDVAAMGITGQQAKRLTGMVQFRDPSSGGHSQLISFRRMTEGSKGWIAKAQPPKAAARAVADAIRPLCEQAFAAAITADVQGMLEG